MDETANRGKLVVISGPAGVGKSTIVKEVLRRTGARYSVSCTTRAPRPGEVEGRDYRFIDRERFRSLAAQGQMLEWAEVFGNLYGTPAGPVREAVAAGQAIVLEIDVQGGLQVARQMPEATFVLIVPPSAQALADRLNGRGTESEDVKALRLSKAQAEIALARSSGVYVNEVVNDDLERAIVQVVNLVQQGVS